MESFKASKEFKQEMAKVVDSYKALEEYYNALVEYGQDSFNKGYGIEFNYCHRLVAVESSSDLKPESILDPTLLRSGVRGAAVDKAGSALFLLMIAVSLDSVSDLLFLFRKTTSSERLSLK